MARAEQFEEQYMRVMQALADSVIDMTDEEIAAEFGAEPKPRTLDIMRAASKTHAQAKLKAARANFEVASEALKTQDFDIPATSQERRILLDAMIGSQIAADAGLMLQFRELSSGSDEDIESTLKQLAALGILKKFRLDGAK